MSDRKKVGIVTGGSRGFGAAHVVKLAEMGYNVAFCYMDPPEFADRWKETKEKAEALGAKVFADVCDVSDYDSVSGFIAKAVEAMGDDQIDVLVSNAGISQGALLVDSTPARVKKVLEVDLLGNFYVIMAVLPHMTPYNSGCIVNTGSTGSFNGLATESAYCAAKTGILGMTRALQMELKDYKIRVNTLCPGGSWTDMTIQCEKDNPERIAAAQAAIPSGRFGWPEEQADVMAFIVNNEFVWGQAIAANGGEAFAR